MRFRFPELTFSKTTTFIAFFQFLDNMMMDLRNAQMKNIESKFAVKGLDDIRLALKKDARFVGVLNQVDTYFNVMHGRLKIRQEGKKHPQSEHLFLVPILC